MGQNFKIACATFVRRILNVIDHEPISQGWSHIGCWGLGDCPIDLGTGLVAVDRKASGSIAAKIHCVLGRKSYVNNPPDFQRICQLESEHVRGTLLLVRNKVFDGFGFVVVEWDHSPLSDNW